MKETFNARAAARALASSCRIAVIGSPGSGKSTLARALRGRLGLPLHHLDRLHWHPGWQPTPDAQWQEVERKLAAGPRWIIDGNYGRTMGIRMARADAVVFLDLPWPLCLLRALRRAIALFGRVREDMGEGCPEQVDLEFMRFIISFPYRQRPMIMTLRAASPPGQTWIVPTSAREVQQLSHELQDIAHVPG